MNTTLEVHCDAVCLNTLFVCGNYGRVINVAIPFTNSIATVTANRDFNGHGLMQTYWRRNHCLSKDCSGSY